jgi:hypothetical protein
LAWGALVFGEFLHTSVPLRIFVFSASAIMIIGALAIAGASASVKERDSCMSAIVRECSRYKIDLGETIQACEGQESVSVEAQKRPWWDFLILSCAVAIFARLAVGVRRPPIAMHITNALILTAVSLVLLVGCGWLLQKQTRFT